MIKTVQTNDIDEWGFRYYDRMEGYANLSADMKELGNIKEIEYTLDSIMRSYFLKEAEIKETIKMIKGDINKLKIDYGVEINDIMKYIKEPKEYIYTIFYNKMKEKDTDLQDLETYMKLYGINYPTFIIEYGENIQYIMKEFKIDVNLLKTNYIYIIIINDPEKIKQIILMTMLRFYGAHINHNRFYKVYEDSNYFKQIQYIITYQKR